MILPKNTLYPRIPLQAAVRISGILKTYGLPKLKIVPHMTQAPTSLSQKLTPGDDNIWFCVTLVLVPIFSPTIMQNIRKKPECGNEWTQGSSKYYVTPKFHSIPYNAPKHF